MAMTLDDQLSTLLGSTIEQLDIPNSQYELAVARYQAVGDFLGRYWDETDTGGLIYPQGSMLLGTVTRLYHRDDEYDIDLVCRRDLAKSSITRLDLKTDVGRGLKLFIRTDPEGDPSMEPGKRCWTLQYPHDPFHMDVLPAIPNPDELPDGILITDRDARAWQKSNPLGFARWFRGAMLEEWAAKRAALARKGVEVDDVPAWKVKTTLQRAVQALKRHRDIFFSDDLKNRTASVIVTTLAAQAYRGEGSLFEVLVDVTARMPGLVEEENGLYIVRNPVEELENFADRWQAHPGRALRFFQWIEQARKDFTGFGQRRGLDDFVARAAKVFGEGPARRVAKTAAREVVDARNKGELAMGVGGALSAGSGTQVRPHHFHGDPPRSPKA